MKNKAIEFKQFLKENNIKKKDLPEPIQEMIEIYDQLYELVDTMEEPNLQELMEQLEKLDIDILEDIEEEYEDLLTNNERTELPKKPEVTIKKSPQKTVPTKEKTDEMILDELVKMKRTKGLRRSKLRGMGLKTKIGGDTIIGKYMLERTSFFYYRYNIVSMK
ncbi:ECF-type sigma factor family protein [Aquimarina algicola]|uniref:Uncharacterized protein n=1 Tax=Aquimarina algicola TaxID=2589995 RepID=A0A504JKZ2_9FLAO|nr:hypothetical protein [Aquimarina algicola]TPN87150.1 hypothetical protein FHK87_06045 [Aquimarina algicola]